MARRNPDQPRRPIRPDRRLAHANFLRLKICRFAFQDERVDAEDLIRALVKDILLPRAAALTGGSDVRAEDLVRDAANEVISRVRACSLRFLSAWIEDRILTRMMRRLLPMARLEVADVGFPPDGRDLVVPWWDPSWLRLFLSLLLLSRRCFAYIRAYLARDRRCGWKGRLADLHLGPGHQPMLSRDLEQLRQLLRELADACGSLVTEEGFDPGRAPADPVERLLWELHFEAFPPARAEDAPPDTARVAQEVTRRLPRASPQYPRLSEALRQLHALTQRPRPPDLCGALEEFQLDLEGSPPPSDPPPPGSPLIQVLDAVGPGHPTLRPAENEPRAVWTALRAASPAPAPPALDPPPPDPLPDEDLYDYLLGKQPAGGPHAMILGFLRREGEERWLDRLYQSADAIFFQEGPIVVPAPDWLDARRRLADWLAYCQGQDAGTVPAHRALWFLEIPPQGRRREDPTALGRAVQVLDAWTAAGAPPPPTAWGRVPAPERDLLRGALSSLYLEDLADDLASW
jgi:hypothetical protein